MSILVRCECISNASSVSQILHLQGAYIKRSVAPAGRKTSDHTCFLTQDTLCLNSWICSEHWLYDAHDASISLKIIASNMLPVKGQTTTAPACCCAVAGIQGSSEVTPICAFDLQLRSFQGVETGTPISAGESCTHCCAVCADVYTSETACMHQLRNNLKHSVHAVTR